MSNGKKRNKENWTPHCHKICQNCGNACYIGEGDTACMLSKMPEGQEKDCECKLPEFVTRLHALTSEAYFAENAEEMVTILLTAVP